MKINLDAVLKYKDFHTAKHPVLDFVLLNNSELRVLVVEDHPGNQYHIKDECHHEVSIGLWAAFGAIILGKQT